MNWLEIARRGDPHPVLLIDTVMEAYRNGLLGLREKHTEYEPREYRQVDGARWLSQETVDGYVSYVRELELSSPGILVEYARDYNDRMARVRAHADAYSQTDFAAAPAATVYEAMEGFLLTTRSQWAYAYHYIMTNRFMPDVILSAIAERVQDVMTQNEYFNDLLQLAEPSEYQRERMSLFALAEYADTQGMDQEFDRLVDSHVAAFAHLGRYLLLGSGYTNDQIRDRVRSILEKGLEKEREQIERAGRMVEHGIRLLETLCFSGSVLKHIDSAASWAAASNNAEASYAYAAYHLQPLFDRIADDFGISYAQVVNMRGCEVLQSLHSGVLAVPADEVAERAKDPSIVLSDREIHVLTGSDLARYKETEVAYEHADDVRELKGQIASHGGVRKGIVRIVLTSKDADRVQRGDILVAPATNPLLVPAMERAGAVVTNEGGLLSHAAIVSRELGIPCIVGITVATKVLRDGELVEVDTELGIVKRMKN